jgi:hypothetical protein
MLKGKPVVSFRPLWRHPVFAWGWYSVLEAAAHPGWDRRSDGYYEPGDGGGGEWAWCPDATDNPNGGTVIAPPTGPGRAFKQYEP